MKTLFQWVVLGALVTSTFSACNKEAYEPEQVAQTATHTMNLDLNVSTSLDLGQGFDDEGRALTFDVLPNTGGSHPKLRLSVNSNQRMHLVFANKQTGQSFVAKDVEWTYSPQTKRLSIKKMTISSARSSYFTNAASHDKWKMYCILGGTLTDNDTKIELDSKNDLQPIGPGEKINLEALFMSKEWVDVTYDRKDDVFRLKDDLGRVVLQNKCTILLANMENRANSSLPVLHFRGFEVKSDKLSFWGKFNIQNLQADKTPAYEGFEHRTNYFPHYTIDEVAKGTKSKWYVMMAYPQAERVNLRITPEWGQDRKYRANDIIKENKLAQPGLVGLSAIAYERRKYRHPIEALLLSEDGLNPVHKNGNISEAEASKSAHQDKYGDNTIYSLPSREEFMVLVPEMQPDKLNIGYAPLRFDKDMKDEEFSETISAWGRPVPSRTILKPSGNHNIVYATRFGGSRDFYSAYRYEKKGNKLNIRVRTLSHSQRTTIQAVSNEGFWTKELDWNQDEYEVELEGAMYWSSTSQKRGTKTVYHMLKIFTTKDMDQSRAYPTAAFVTSTAHYTYLDNPNLWKNRSNKIILMTEDGGVQNQPIFGGGIPTPPRKPKPKPKPKPGFPPFGRRP